ncbi:MAG: glutamate racemase [Saprospiraceae bacterium]
MKGPIGVFDSGYGGLTILNQFRAVLPQYNYLYLGDNARSPYGIRSFDTIYEYTLEAVKYLFSQNCHLIIIACNTASAKALVNIQKLDLPLISPTRRVLGVIRPTVEEMGCITTTRHVGILATEGTVTSESYLLEMNKLHPETTVFQEACPMWVPLIENGEFDSEGARYFINRNIQNLLSQSPQIDTILLGCTHYPVLYDVIQEYIPPHIKIIAQGKIIAKSLKAYLQRHPEIDKMCHKENYTTFLTTGSAVDFNKRASSLLNSKVLSTRVESLIVGEKQLPREK